ncbi:NosD domain-containing protein [Microbulbifer sp. ANSA003]|uniref:NosD domain-containing protein n=1 Tax=unclassified Microbulbifer TaxID=2619833 RepID=UPI00403A50BB
MKKLTIALCYILLTTAAISTSINSYAVTCGGSITTAETLTEDLNCTTNFAFSIVGPSGSLNMNGFTVTCPLTANNGIVLGGFFARISSGTVENCNNSITLTGDGSHQVVDVDIVNPTSTALFVRSDHNFISGVQIQSNVPDSNFGIRIENNDFNQVFGNTVDGMDNVGVQIEGSSNSVSGNIITNTSDTNGSGVGISIEPPGSSNIVTSNIIDQSAGEGILTFESDSNLISQNVVTNSLTGIAIDNADSNTVTINSVSDNTDYGISIEDANASGNNILSNSSLNNGIFDLYSPDDPSCTANTWLGNTFVTSDPSCLN